MRALRQEDLHHPHESQENINIHLLGNAARARSRINSGFHGGIRRKQKESDKSSCKRRGSAARRRTRKTPSDRDNLFATFATLAGRVVTNGYGVTIATTGEFATGAKNGRHPASRSNSMKNLTKIKEICSSARPNSNRTLHWKLPFKNTNE